MNGNKLSYDLVVVGGGAGGTATAITAAREGLHVLLVERNAALGGTATQAGVSCWEPGIGGTGFPFELYQRMKARKAAGIYTMGRHFGQDGSAQYWATEPNKVCFPGGEARLDPTKGYIDSLRRHMNPGEEPTHAIKQERWHGVPFEREVCEQVMAEFLEETGNAEALLGVAFEEVEVQDGRILAIRLSDGSRIEAPLWIDGTDGVLCAACGCETFVGRDPKSRFGEPSAPEEPEKTLNAVTLMYHTEGTDDERIEPLPEGVPAKCWWQEHFPVMSCVERPFGGRACNMLPTMQGIEAWEMGPKKAWEECRRRVYAHWHFVQTHWPEFRRQKFAWLAPMLGIRESRRVLAEYTLVEQDVRGGFQNQPHEDMIALADHALDRHGIGGQCGELEAPYGVPYRCLIPKGMKNLLIASRAAGFSSIAASSCRLTRTMMQLGQAAGLAAVLATDGKQNFPSVESDALRDLLRERHCQVDWPMPEKWASKMSKI